MEPTNILSRRPAPPGYDVHVIDIENGGRGLIILFLNGEIISQDTAPDLATAKTQARHLACRHKCAMIVQLPYANRNYP